MTTRRPLLVVSIPLLTLITAGLLIAQDSTGRNEYLLGAYGSLLVLAIVGSIVVRKSVSSDPFVVDEATPSEHDIERVMTDNVATVVPAKDIVERHDAEAAESASNTMHDVDPEPAARAVPVLAAEARQELSLATEVFVNLGRRNKQLNRQMLTLISHLERDELDPDTLQGLYELDHLATRMKRHEEALLMLASTRRVRQWSPAVPLEDVLRSALAEVERFARVELDHVPNIAVEGSALPDLTHLLAELIDNATEFSHASTLVTVSAHTTLEGLEIEVFDSGHGIDEPKRELLNTLLADPPTVEKAPSRRLGLFIVAHYARNLGVEVELAGEREVGTVATVAIGHELLVEVDGELDEEMSLEAIELLDPVLQIAVGSELAEEDEDELATASLPTEQEVEAALATFPSVEIVDPTPLTTATTERAEVFPSIADIPSPAGVPLPSRIPQATFESVWGDDERTAMPAPDVFALAPMEFDEDEASGSAEGAASTIAAFSAGVERGLIEAESELAEDPAAPDEV